MGTLVDLASQYKNQLVWVGWLSIVMLIVSAALIPVLVSRIPENYFATRPRQTGREYSWRSLAVSCARNLFALLLLLAGLLMLVLPGQGLITILIALFVADLPGKQKLERRLMSHPKLLSSINWLRAQRGVVPLSPPNHQAH
jgi:MFS family permease